MHYVCKGCSGLADHPKVCETDGCLLEGQELEACDCEHPESHKADAEKTASEE